MFTPLCKPLFWILDFINKGVHNWGLAIILVTLLIKLVFYRLSAASYKSMARMRKVQPKMMSLRERYADDKAKLNQAMWDLYKKEKINPLGGCLPILIQMPVFLSLYWVLIESVEMRHAPFMLWIHDLSSTDPLYILPLLMGISMWAQFKLNPKPTDPMQEKVFMLMPVFMMAFMAFFPAGLVLYWFVNNLLSIAQQYYITKRYA
jgi:YidC/Oxa1 family membrane protein insertase